MSRLDVRPLVLLLLALAAGCGDDSTDGAGGGDAYSEDPVLGTEHDGTCETASAFDAQCEAEGGIRTETCQDAGCNNRGGRCAVPPPATLEDGQFVCGDADVCSADQLCITGRPIADGCADHRCEAIPASCAEGPTCDCVLENTSPGLSRSRRCTEVDGHFVIDETL